LNVTRSDDSSSVLKPTSLQVETFRHTNAVSAIEVDVYPLDSKVSVEEVSKPVLLKIDVQGFELEVLNGATRLLASGIDVLVELSFVELYEGQALASDVVSALVKREYLLRGIYSITKAPNGTPLQADFLFESHGDGG